MSFLVLQLMNPNYKNPYNQNNMYGNMGIGGGTLDTAYQQGTNNAMLNTTAPVTGGGPSPDEIARREQMEKKRKQQQAWNTANQIGAGIGTGLEIGTQMFGQGGYDHTVGMTRPGFEYKHVNATNIPIVDMLISGGVGVGKMIKQRKAYNQALDRRGMMDAMNEQQQFVGPDYTGYARSGKYHNPYAAYGKKMYAQKGVAPKEISVYYSGLTPAEKEEQQKRVTGTYFESPFARDNKKQQVRAIEEATGMRSKGMTKSQAIELGNVETTNEGMSTYGAFEQWKQGMKGQGNKTSNLEGSGYSLMESLGDNEQYQGMLMKGGQPVKQLNYQQRVSLMNDEAGEPYNSAVLRQLLSKKRGMHGIVVNNPYLKKKAQEGLVNRPKKTITVRGGEKAGLQGTQMGQFLTRTQLVRRPQPTNFSQMAAQEGLEEMINTAGMKTMTRGDITPSDVEPEGFGANTLYDYFKAKGYSAKDIKGHIQGAKKAYGMESGTAEQNTKLLRMMQDNDLGARAKYGKYNKKYAQTGFLDDPLKWVQEKAGAVADEVIRYGKEGATAIESKVKGDKEKLKKDLWGGTVVLSNNDNVMINMPSGTSERTRNRIQNIANSVGNEEQALQLIRSAGLNDVADYHEAMWRNMDVEMPWSEPLQNQGSIESMIFPRRDEDALMEDRYYPLYPEKFPIRSMQFQEMGDEAREYYERMAAHKADVEKTMTFKRPKYRYGGACNPFLNKKKKK